MGFTFLIGRYRKCSDTIGFPPPHTHQFLFNIFTSFSFLSLALLWPPPPKHTPPSLNSQPPVSMCCSSSQVSDIGPSCIWIWWVFLTAYLKKIFLVNNGGCWLCSGYHTRPEIEIHEFDSRQRTTNCLCYSIFWLLYFSVCHSNSNLFRRKRKQGLQRNIYEDVSPTPNENIYTSLQASEQLQHERNGACPTVNSISKDDDSFHEYHSVYFPNFQLRSVSAKSKNPTKTVRYIKQQTVKKYWLIT